MRPSQTPSRNGCRQGPVCSRLRPARAISPSLLLKTRVHTQATGQRPLIELEPTDHPLAVEQRTGITMARVQQIAESLLHL